MTSSKQDADARVEAAIVHLRSLHRFDGRELHALGAFEAAIVAREAAQWAAIERNYIARAADYRAEIEQLHAMYDNAERTAAMTDRDAAARVETERRELIQFGVDALQRMETETGDWTPHRHATVVTVLRAIEDAMVAREDAKHQSDPEEQAAYCPGCSEEGADHDHDPESYPMERLGKEVE